jgi:hypothetical protein
MSGTARRLRHASAPRPPAFELTASRQFTAWLAEQKASLAFTTYQAGKLFLLACSRTISCRFSIARSSAAWGSGRALSGS